MSFYVPGTQEKDQKKVNKSIQQAAKAIETVSADNATNTTAIATNIANIATNTANIATNTANIATNASHIATNTTNIASNASAITTLQALVPAPRASNTLGTDVALSNISNFFDGPSMSLASGTWYVSGQVTVQDTAGAANINAKLWDGTTVIASGSATTSGTNARLVISLSGITISPAANVRISCQDTSSTSGKILANISGGGKDSCLFGIRIA